MICQRCEAYPCTCGAKIGLIAVWDWRLQAYHYLFYGQGAAAREEEMRRRFG